jgi:hypothetical protein
MVFFSRIQQLASSLFQRQSYPSTTPAAGLTSQQYERAVLDLFARGFLTIDEVMEQLAHASYPKAF